jgi:predicted Zn-dependent peptidase
VEKIIKREQSDGSQVFLVPKPDFKEKFAMVCVNFGSSAIRYGGTKLPFGTAHFLEHKLFDDEKLDILDEFSELEAEVNAYTNYSNTSYFFSCAKNFEKSFDLLLKFTSTPYFERSRVESEKSVITQEIKMYEDYPTWKVFLNMAKNLFTNDAFYKNIAGDAEDILQIDENILRKAYGDFYCAQNIFVVAAGSVGEEVFDLARGRFRAKAAPAIDFAPETRVADNYIEDTAQISNPIFCLGFKERVSENPMKNSVCAKLLNDIFFGVSSEFYEKAYNGGLIDADFSADYNNCKHFAVNVLTGTSRDARALSENILKELEKNINPARFEQIKKKHIGRFIREFNGIESVANLLSNCVSRGYDFFGLFNCLKEIQLADVADYRENNFLKDNYVLSILNPS